jgi:hypothetical protein
MARLQMLAVAMGSAAAGFLTTFTLLHLHVQAMWLRYGVSVIVAYGLFLLLIWPWISQTDPHRERSRFLAIFNPGIYYSLVAIFGAILLFGVLYSLVFGMIQEDVAEIALDGALGAVICLQLGPPSIRRTALPFLCLLVLFVGAGIAAQTYAPEATSIGGVIRHATQEGR